MPYPILKLPYGLQKRLRSLASPKERYYLQVAVGLEKNYLGPLQMCIKDSKCSEFHLEEFEKFQIDGDDGETRVAENDNLFLLEGTLRIYDFEPDDYDNPFYDHFLIKSHTFLMTGIKHPEVPEKLSKLCDPKLLTYLGTGKCSPEVTLSSIMDSFNNLDSIFIESQYYRSNWMKDMLKFKSLKLKNLDIQSQFEKLFCFKPEELSQLYKNLHPQFVLTLYCNELPNNAAEIVRQKLGSHFKEINSEPYPGGGYLLIKLQDYLYFQIREQTPL